MNDSLILALTLTAVVLIFTLGCQTTANYITKPPPVACPAGMIKVYDHNLERERCI